MWTNICKNINNKIKKKKIISPNDNFHEFLTYLSLERLMPTTIFILSRKNVEKQQIIFVIILMIIMK